MWKLSSYWFWFVSVMLLIVAFRYGFQVETIDLAQKTYFYLSLNANEKQSAFGFIALNNLGVAFTLSVLGFISGGILVFFILGWNGYMFGLICKDLYENYTNPTEAILKHVLPHGIPEIIAFLLFAKIGLKGFKFFRKTIKENVFDRKLLPSVNSFLYPTILLVLSAFIEAFISSSL